MRALALVLALAGCSKILGIDDVKLGTGSDNGDGGTGTDAPANTVIGKSFNRCLQISGAATFDYPTDLSSSVIAALLPDGSATGYTVVPGTGHADGTFEIDNVPDGMEYVLKIDRGYFVTSAHVIDSHGEGPFRCNPAQVPPTTTTNLVPSVTGMQPFVNQESTYFATVDSIEVDSLALGAQTFGAASTGATTFSTPVDWNNSLTIYGTQAGLLDPSLGDDLEIVHTRSDIIFDTSKRFRTFTHVIDSFVPTGIALTNGMDTPVPGAFTKGTDNKNLNFSINRSLYDGSFPTSTAFNDLSVTFVAHPLVEDFGSGVTVAALDFVDWSRSASNTATVNDLPYADPYPTSWHRYEFVSYLRNRPFKLPGTTKTANNFGQMSRLLEYTGTPNVTPTLFPPAAIKIAGKDFVAGGMIPFDGVTPVEVTWNAVAQAKGYFVGVRRIVMNGQGSTAATSGSVETAGTSVKIPAEVFAGGQFFTFTVSAFTTPTDYVGGHLTQNGEPSQNAIAPSGLFRLSADCGNGSVDTGEDCDTSGESATCDVDCSTAICGDGLRNATAGEQCDTVVDTAACNATTCRTPACGDGYINTQAGEDCDDGNTSDDGNGCSATCKLDNTCGDGVTATATEVDAFGTTQPIEDCDTHGTDAATGGGNFCNGAMCRFNYCGDGHVNAAAGEQCDDGNQESGDGCETDCKTTAKR